MKAALSLLFVSALIVAGCKITDPNETPATPPTLKILPDTARGTTMQWINFRALWSDSANHARYYFWDFGDSATVTTTGTVGGHTYLNAGAYHLHLLALDAHDSVVGSANSVAVIGRMPITVALDSDSYTIDHDGSYTFHATLTPAMYNVQYVWTLVNDTTVSTGQANSVNLNFTKTGPYVLRVDVVSNGAIIASDTANVTVTYPTVTADELAGMGSLEIFAVKNTDTIHTTVGLSNSFGNSFTRSGQSFAASHYAKIHQNLANGRALDSSDYKFAFWRLSGDHMLDTTSLVWIDSSWSGTADTNRFTIRKARVAATRALLTERSTSHITFTSYFVEGFSIDNTTTVTPPPIVRGSDCRDVGAIRLIPYCTYYVTFIFHASH